MSRHVLAEIRVYVQEPQTPRRRSFRRPNYISAKLHGISLFMTYFGVTACFHGGLVLWTISSGIHFRSFKHRRCKDFIDFAFYACGINGICRT